MQLVSYSQTLVAGGALSVASFGILVWFKGKQNKANVFIGLLAVIFAFWISAPWFAELGMGWRYLTTVWYVIYAVLLGMGPAICLHASTIVACRAIRTQMVTAYTWSAAVTTCLVLGTILQKFGWNQELGNVLLYVAIPAGLLAYSGVLLLIIWDHSPKLFACVNEDPHAYVAVILFILFLCSGSLQMTWGPVAMQPYLAFASLLFFVVGVSASVRFGFLGIVLHPLEGFFLALIGGSAVLLLHSSDITEFWISLGALILVALYGRLAIRMVAREHERGEHMALLNQQLRELDEVRNDFTAMVAHQLRSPIGGIRAAATALRDGTFGQLPATAKDTVSLIINSTGRLLNMAETYLQAVRLHQGRFATQVVDTDVAEVLQTVTRELAPLAELKKLELTFQARDVPPVLSLDREVLLNSIFNLTDNAIKYTDHGSVKVEAQWKSDILIISVTDTGMGMKPEELRSAFDKYARGSSARARQVAGTGLGLYIVKRLLRAVGGKVEAQSKGLGQGSVFRLTIPATKPTNR